MDEAADRLHNGDEASSLYVVQMEGAAHTMRAPCTFFIQIVYLTPLFCFVFAP